MISEPSAFTLWDLADVVREEVEKVYREDESIREVSNLVLVHLLWTRVKNVELLDDAELPVIRGAYAEP